MKQASLRAAVADQKPLKKESSKMKSRVQNSALQHRAKRPAANHSRQDVIALDQALPNIDWQQLQKVCHLIGVTAAEFITDAVNCLAKDATEDDSLRLQIKESILNERENGWGTPPSELRVMDPAVSKQEQFRRWLEDGSKFARDINSEIALPLTITLPFGEWQSVHAAALNYNCSIDRIVGDCVRNSDPLMGWSSETPDKKAS